MFFLVPLLDLPFLTCLFFELFFAFLLLGPDAVASLSRCGLFCFSACVNSILAGIPLKSLYFSTKSSASLSISSTHSRWTSSCLLKYPCILASRASCWIACMWYKILSRSSPSKVGVSPVERELRGWGRVGEQFHYRWCFSSEYGHL